MWPDNDTDLDFLNFGGVAGTVAEIITQAQGRPISIGVSGSWGAGKSSMIRLVRNSLVERAAKETSRFVFVEFNAWLYQGYDDARAALMEVIASALAEEAEKRETGVDKAKDFLRRVKWLRLAKVAGAVVAAAAGVPPLALAGEAVGFLKGLGTGETSSDAVAKVKDAGEDIGKASEGGFLASKQPSSLPEAIHELRDSFEATLKALDVTLVVLIDDLDRCLPETTVSTLEAMRLFLFLKNAAFVIAADTEMIKHAVRRHFDGVNDDLVTNYFDKLIQVPIRVPPLGTQEVRAYQSIVVAYERARGTRVVHQRCDGAFEVSVSKVIAASTPALVTAFTDATLRKEWSLDADARLVAVLDASLTAPASKGFMTRPDGRSRFRFKWDDTTVQLNLYPKGPAKASIVVQQTGLRGAGEVERQRGVWKAAFAALAATIATTP